MGLLWLSIAVLILVGTYVSIPNIAARILRALILDAPSNPAVPASILGGYTFYFAILILLFGMSSVAFACYLLGRTAFLELDLAARANGLADSLCIAGGEMEIFEKASTLLVPKRLFIASSSVFSEKDKESIIQFVKLLRKQEL